MGNRAVIVIAPKGNFNADNCQSSTESGIYLHWNGGRDSVEAFLKYCQLQNFRSPATDEQYARARLVQIIANFFDGGLSIGVGQLKHLDCDNYDNGVYVVYDNWEIVDRIYFEGIEQQQYAMKDMLIEIDEKQPAYMQLGRKYIETLFEEKEDK